MRTTTSLSLDGVLLDQAKAVATGHGTNFSAWTEKLIRDEVLRESLRTAANYESSQGRDTAQYWEQAEAEAAAMAEAMRRDGAE